jgi:hypothetical protein
MRIDVHQHLWTEPFVDALAARDELPFVRREQSLNVLYSAGERPYVIDVGGASGTRRAELVARDGLDRALICMSSPVGVERLARDDAMPLLDAYHDGALSLGEPFGVWGSLSLERTGSDDVDRALARGCVGISLPAGALAGLDALASLRPILRRLEDVGAPLLVHPGPGRGVSPAMSDPDAEPALADPLWWSALTRYVSQMHAAWLTFVGAVTRRAPAPAHDLHDARRARAAARRATVLTRRARAAGARPADLLRDLLLRSRLGAARGRDRRRRADHLRLRQTGRRPSRARDRRCPRLERGRRRRAPRDRRPRARRSTRRRSRGWAPTRSTSTACSPATRLHRLASCDRSPKPRSEGPLPLLQSRAGGGGQALAPERRSTPAPPAITTPLTSSGSNRPWSTTPGVRLSESASSRASATGPT